MPFDEGRVNFAINKGRVRENLSKDGDGCFNSFDMEFCKCPAHGGDGFGTSRFVNQ